MARPALAALLLLLAIVTARVATAEQRAADSPAGTGTGELHTPAPAMAAARLLRTEGWPRLGDVAGGGPVPRHVVDAAYRAASAYDIARAQAMYSSRSQVAPWGGAPYAAGMPSPWWAWQGQQFIPSPYLPGSYPLAFAPHALGLGCAPWPLAPCLPAPTHLSLAASVNPYMVGMHPALQAAASHVQVATAAE